MSTPTHFLGVKFTDGEDAAVPPVLVFVPAMPMCTGNCPC